MKLKTLRDLVQQPKDFRYRKVSLKWVKVKGIGCPDTQWAAYQDSSSTGRWNVTHCPSGMRVGREGLSRKQAVELLYWLEKADIPKFKTAEDDAAIITYHVAHAVDRQQFKVQG